MSIEAMKLLTEIAHIVRTTHLYGPEMRELLEREAALRQAIEQEQKQEPVAVISSVVHAGESGVRILWFGGFPQIGDKLYTSPSQRQWVGLTDEDIFRMGLSNYVQVIREAEAKLKEKNT